MLFYSFSASSSQANNSSTASKKQSESSMYDDWGQMSMQSKSDTVKQGIETLDLVRNWFGPFWNILERIWPVPLMTHRFSVFCFLMHA